MMTDAPALGFVSSVKTFLQCASEHCAACWQAYCRGYLIWDIYIKNIFQAQYCHLVEYKQLRCRDSCFEQLCALVKFDSSIV